MGIVLYINANFSGIKQSCLNFKVIIDLMHLQLAWNQPPPPPPGGKKKKK